MTTSFTLTLDRLRDGQYRFGITPSAIADEEHSHGPSIFEAGTLDEAMFDLEIWLFDFSRDYRDASLPITNDDADLGLILNGVPGSGGPIRPEL